MSPIKIDRVYTRTGDDGQTSLLDGVRVSKGDLRVEAYGVVDELNSYIGYSRSLLTDNHYDLSKKLIGIQQELFDIGAELATQNISKLKNIPLISATEVRHLEELCDSLSKDLEPLNSFVIPGTDVISATLHIARTFARRSERAVIKLIEVEGSLVRPEIIHYLNRLSDLLFIMSRVVELGSGREITMWSKPTEREKPS